jgi:hypothetical protein
MINERSVGDGMWRGNRRDGRERVDDQRGWRVKNARFN